LDDGENALSFDVVLHSDSPQAAHRKTGGDMTDSDRDGRADLAPQPSSGPQRTTTPTVRRAIAAIVLAACTTGLLVALLTSASAAPLAARSGAPVTSGSQYLALGDSVTFGTEEPQVVPAPNYHDPASFLGYPEQLGAELHLRAENAACPGETAASMINSAAQSLGCENTVPGGPPVYRPHYPLHVSYSGTQLGYALTYLHAHPDVRLVSLMIGANDLYLCVRTTHDGCNSHTEQHAALGKLAHDVQQILSAIRTEAHYNGQLAIVNYYSPDYASASTNALFLAVNSTVDAAARPFHVVVADGYAELKAAAAHSGDNTCKAGLLTQLGRPGKCGIHPSYAGQALLAQALEKVIRL
jgi:lysophospholipase L1-like esterase